jgi:hypothetical protein
LAPQPAAPAPEPAAGDLNNGNFSIADPADIDFGWTARGNVFVNAVGQGVLGEGDPLFSGFSQTFNMPAGARKLRFTLVGANFVSNGSGPVDAFEAALLKSSSMTSALGAIQGMTLTDSLFNLQSDGQAFIAPGVFVAGLAQSGGFISPEQSRIVEIDLSGIAAGTALTLYFDLLGFGGDESTVAIDNVQFVFAVVAPTLEVSLDPASDSATKGDGLTNINPVVVRGQTDANQTVLLDVDGDGFDDGSVVADTGGVFVFNNVNLAQGANTLRFRAAGPGGTTDRQLSLILDTKAPSFLPPAVINNGNTQRSGIFRIQFAFDDNIGSALDLANLTLIRDGRFLTPLDGATLSFDPTTKRATLDLKNVNLIDGEYELRINPDLIADGAGNSLDVDGDGQGDIGTGKFASIPFFKLAGDANADKAVNALDLLVVRKTLDKSAGQAGFDPNGDLDDSGTANAADLATVSANLGHTLVPMSAPKLVIQESSFGPNDDAVHFGAVTLGSAATPIDILFRNDGQKTLTVAALQITGPDAASFTFQILGDEPGNTGFVLGANMTKVIRISLNGQRAGELSASLRFWSNDPAALSGRSVSIGATVSAAGQGNALPPPVAPPPATVGTVQSGEVLTPVTVNRPTTTTNPTRPTAPQPRPKPAPARPLFVASKRIRPAPANDVLVKQFKPAPAKAAATPVSVRPAAKPPLRGAVRPDVFNRDAGKTLG